MSKAPVHINTYRFQSPFGALLVGETTQGICSLTFINSLKTESTEQALDEIRRQFPRAQLTPVSEGNCNLAAYFDNPREALLPLDIHGSEFQRHVWQALAAIPFGEVRSYQQIAQAIEKPSASRAVANACGANKISLLIPCHRVIASSGALGGYHWGIERKARLLEWEAGLFAQ